MLGRPSNNLKMGIVGMPNIGKSTLFNALTSSSVAAENYPFCTIDPSESRVAVPDTRLDWLCGLYKPRLTTPANLTVIDIAGLVKGAAEGEGLGNAFLANIKAVDGIFHLCRAFESEDVVHVEDSVDPVRDLEIIHEELRLKDEEFLTKQLEAKKKEINRMGKGGPTTQAKLDEFKVYEQVYECVVIEEADVRAKEWTAEEVDVINSMQLLTAKPVVYLCNVSEEEYLQNSNAWIPKIKDWIEKFHPGDLLIPYSGQLEAELAAMTIAEKTRYLEDISKTHGLPNVMPSAMPSIILAGYKALRLINYFTAGVDEVRAWTIRQGTKAPAAAGVIHSDFEKAFVTAEVMKFDDLKVLGSENAVKAAGKSMQKGRDYVVEDGDIMCK
ncbi:Obg-like ATPase [Gaertneriomyces sp. JEL0708]|nr:Obg-like ATPase [Gaertneriomyces sp. JEL0708]